MLMERDYDRRRVWEYARRWAYGRNPLFYDFSGLGGDCTNFISQCLLAGCCTMNCTPTFGWYYDALSARSPSWTGVEFLYDFLTSNEGAGPYGRAAGLSGLDVGDLIQLGDRQGRFYHTLLVTGYRRGDYLVSAHSYDAFDRPLSAYSYARLRPVRIEGFRAVRDPSPDSFANLLNGVSRPMSCS